jgi:hypothetical protein
MPPTNSIASPPHTQGDGRLETKVGKGLHEGLRPARHLAPAVHGEIPAAGDADHRPGQRHSEIVERLELRQQQFGLGLRIGHDVPPRFIGALLLGER